jgi:Cu-Zn family superoxide dismutase
MIRKALSMAILGGALAASPVAFAQDVQQARALMLGADGSDAGTITIDRMKSGYLRIMVEMTGLPPGPHGFHVHEKGACDAAGKFESAGGHYAAGHQHGIEVEGGPHPGDFPNIHVGADGVLKVEFFSNELGIADGDHPLLDADGSAFVVHADPDDYQSQPSGNSGDRIACGVVEQAS